MKITRCLHVAGLFLLVNLPAADEASSAKTHTLFMGADIDLQQVKDFYRVQNVSRGSFVIKVNGKEKNVPMKFSTVNMKVQHALKLSETSVDVSGLTVERAYTLANDPTTKFIAEQAGNSANSEAATNAYKLVVANMMASRAANNVGTSALGGVGGVLMITAREFGDTPGNKPGDIQAQFDAVQRSFDASASALVSDRYSAAVGADKLARELGEEMYDAVEVTFKVSCDKTLNSPYAVVIAQFSEYGAKPSEVQNWVYATELDPITPDTHRVTIKQGGFPRGFKLKSSQLHLYNRGQELATTVASKRVPLTREEAFEYVMIDHIATHKGQTLPASLAMGRLPAEQRSNLKLPVLYVKVTKDGLPGAAFSDEACTQKIDDLALEASLRTMRFKPALEKGKAVDGVASL